ncbi:double-stranded RNA-binding protein Staufen homolog isoform X2 [Ostrea edulis]|uniref:double-stranded RNA-binding protein Staufen homolog isoform X2 n=1 Tax=Ostrea edulis TaxID=37623 RepID=UPI0024AE8E87|nr:double-stranded RNA-binding protein Staufen homolog isoform X2 [Ostrea edulis]
MKKQTRGITAFSTNAGMSVQVNSSQTTNSQPQNQRSKGGMMGVGIVQKNVVTTALQNSPIMPAASYPTMHQIPAANHTATITSTAVPLASQNGSMGLPVGQLPQSGIAQQTAPTINNPAITPTQQATNTTANSAILDTPTEEQNSENNLANTKEKTPMCLINELARYNKISHQYTLFPSDLSPVHFVSFRSFTSTLCFLQISHQYTLVDEQGPAHKKTFYVQLKLGDTEEYAASGPSIKKAQHAAAAEALEKTTFTHPPSKPNKPNHNSWMTDYGNQPITPTVELNALAMKRGEQTIYKPTEAQRQLPYYQCPPNYNYRGLYNQRYHYPRIVRVFYVSLKVGQREFIGEGPTRQDARHDAAKKALHILRKLPVPSNGEKKVENLVEVDGTPNDKDVVKSEISLVHEVALKRNMSVSFDVIRESGPPHMKTFVTRCKVGDMETESEGNSKKVSKKKAADLMLEKLKELPPLPPSVIRPRAKISKKKNKNIIKQMQKADPNYGVGINPISRLIQIQQAQQKKEPVYTLLTERGLPRRREFVIQVQVDDQTCTGVGPNKKLAKRHAAEAMLTLLGYNKPSPQPAKPAIKSTNNQEETGIKKVTFQETSEENATENTGNGKSSGGRQLVPGLLLLPDSKYSSTVYRQPQSGTQPLDGHVSFSKLTNSATRPEIHLRDLTSRNNVVIKFDEFQSGQGSTSEYLSRVSLMSTPQRVFHGSGMSAEAARDSAALEALKFLEDLGKGDGPQVEMEGDLASTPSLGGAVSARGATM